MYEGNQKILTSIDNLMYTMVTLIRNIIYLKVA